MRIEVFIVLLFGLSFLACVPTEAELARRHEEKYSVCEFRPGDMVRAKVSGEVGQVIVMRRAYEKDWCFSDVRFAGSEVFTDARILSDDGPITSRPLQIVTRMRPYELEHVE